tara:strand:+ start:691 stop:1434 length:744 start_codon:yes stop_codon:yes gene_type:complete
MKNNLYNLKSFNNIFLKPSRISEVVSQIIYGEDFRVISKKKNWLKIKTNFDNYVGYIENKKIISKYKPTHKVYKKKSYIYKIQKKKFIKTKIFLSFASRFPIINKKKKFIEFEQNKWLKKDDVKKIDHQILDYKKVFRYFLNTKYKWGGKHFSGIDCSGLIQIFFYYNQIFCPRDTKDQLPFFKKMKIDKFRIKKKLIFWKGHVAVCVDRKSLIHAYGPKKKVIIMNINKTLLKIFKDTNLKPIYVK